MLLRDVDRVHVLHIIREPPLRDLDIIAAHLPLPHPTIFGESPVFQAVTTLPLHAVVFVLVLIPELHGDTVSREGEKLFTQAIRLLLIPLLGQKVDDGLGPSEELVAVAPDAVFGVRFGDRDRVP